MYKKDTKALVRYSFAIINETTEAITHESAFHWLFPDAFIIEQQPFG